MPHIIYIIDDNMVSEFATRMVIEQSNIKCSIVSFDSGEAGLRAIKESVEKNFGIPTLILLDLNMPCMDGWQFLEKLRATDRLLKRPLIYLVSSYADAKVRERAERYELLSGYFERPLSIQNITTIFSTLAI